MFIRRRSENRPNLLAALGLRVLRSLLSVSALAQSGPPPKPSGSLDIHQVQVAFIGSGVVGGGTLYFHGRRYPFKLGGLGIGRFGVSTLDATGNVYNLSRSAGFCGRLWSGAHGMGCGRAG
jgi:hypothetical protein